MDVSSKLILGPNKRPVNESHVRQLLHTFKTDGPQSLTEHHMLLIGVRSSSVRVRELAKSPKDNLPEMPWADSSANQRAVLYNGQHRIAAMTQFLKPLQQKFDKFLRLSNSHEPGPEQEAALDSLRAIKADLEGMAFWGVVVYDIGGSLSVPRPFPAQVVPRPQMPSRPRRTVTVSSTS